LGWKSDGVAHISPVVAGAGVPHIGLIAAPPQHAAPPTAITVLIEVVDPSLKACCPHVAGVAP
jgi:hypothetical protein